MAAMRVTLRDLGEAAGKDYTQKQNWVPDDASQACLLCGVGFSLTRRRHHQTKATVMCHVKSHPVLVYMESN